MSFHLSQIFTIYAANNNVHIIQPRLAYVSLIIENVNTGQKAGLTGIQMISELKPLEPRSIKWDQKDTEVKQVKPGIYQAKISSISNNTSKERQISAANTTFAIRSDR